ncbi:MAG: ATP-binding protein [Pyrinomonadaceae bacterium]|nr:ATP-binding protein [Pyrinomonadaceae bacterium]
MKPVFDGMDSNYKKILATDAPADFVGRTPELDALRRHAGGANQARGLLFLSAPAVGASEILKQTYDRLFHEKGDVVPFYFAVQESDKTAKNCAARFLNAFIAQIIAFRQDAQILDVALDLGEVAEHAAPEDAEWIERLVAACQSENRLDNDRAFVRNCLSAPLRAAAEGANVFVMLDNLHEAESLSGEIDLFGQIKEIFSRSNAPFVLAGRRRYLLKESLTGNAKLTDAEVLTVEPLDFSDACLLTEKLAAKYAVEINEPTRDLMVRQFAGNPTFIEFMMSAANTQRVEFDSFQRVEQIYADEIFGGRIAKFYDALFRQIAPRIEIQREIVELFHDGLAAENEKMPIEAWLRRFGADAHAAYRTVALLNSHEIIRLSSNLVEPMAENEVLSDYVTARYRLEIAAENRASTVGAMLSQFLRRAPQTMAKFYREKSAIGLRELLAHFNRQETPLYLLDYSIYKELLEAAENAGDHAETITLPRVIYTAHTAAFYPPFGQVTDKTRSAVAFTFEDNADADETIWLAAEIESKLEASPEKAEFWCDRLEMVALTCGFRKYKIWLIAPEGFAPAAMETLRQRSAFGSNRRQVERLAEFLQAAADINQNPAANEYEIIVPMGDDSELIAANAIEEIARRHHFAPKAINQIKTALVEACINATEHSLSPDRKIYQKFVVEKDRIIVTISNRGLRLTDKQAEEFAPVEGRRGWGLKLMKTLMDEVKFEQVDDGTRISMTKYLK